MDHAQFRGQRYTQTLALIKEEWLDARKQAFAVARYPGPSYDHRYEAGPSYDHRYEASSCRC